MLWKFDASSFVVLIPYQGDVAASGLPCDTAAPHAPVVSHAVREQLDCQLYL